MNKQDPVTRAMKVIDAALAMAKKATLVHTYLESSSASHHEAALSLAAASDYSRAAQMQAQSQAKAIAAITVANDPLYGLVQKLPALLELARGVLEAGHAHHCDFGLNGQLCICAVGKMAVKFIEQMDEDLGVGRG